MRVVVSFEPSFVFCAREESFVRRFGDFAGLVVVFGVLGHALETLVHDSYRRAFVFGLRSFDSVVRGFVFLWHSKLF